MARPSKLTPSLERRICKAIAGGERLEDAAAAAGISRKTLHRWMARGARDRAGPHRALFLAVSAALRENRDALLNVVRRASRYDARAAIYLLSRNPLERSPLKRQKRDPLTKLIEMMDAESSADEARNVSDTDSPMQNPRGKDG